MNPEQEHATANGTVGRRGKAESVRAADEISLYDLWNVLARRRLIIVGVLMLAIVAGGLYSMLKEPRYDYEAVIQLGDTPEDAGGPLSPQWALSTLRAVYLPDAIERFINESHRLPVPHIEAQLQEGERIIVLSGQAGKSIGELYTEVMFAASKALVANHQPRIAAHRRSLEGRLNQLQNQIGITEREEEQLGESLNKLSALESSLDRQLATLEVELAGLRAQRSQLTAGDEPPAASIQPLLALNQSIAEVLGQITDLKATAELAITERRDELIQNIASKNWSRDTLRVNLAQLETELEQIEPTHLLREPQQSLESTDPGTAVILALSAILGLMLGVFAAFVVEFLRNAKVHGDF